MQGLHHAFSDPSRLALWVKGSIVELVQSTIDDVNKGRFYSYLTRWRQPEEMYTRALYMLFVAPQAEIPHVVSGEMPNSFSAMWQKVNKTVFDGKGTLDKKQVGLSGEEFTAMNTLNNSAHASLATIATCIGIVRNPQRMAIADQHLTVWKTYCNHLDYLEKMFGEGKSKAEVLDGFKNLLKNPSAWQPKPATTPAQT